MFAHSLRLCLVVALLGLGLIAVGCLGPALTPPTLAQAAAPSVKPVADATSEIQSLDAKLKNEPNNRDAYYQRGRLYQSQGHSKQALADYAAAARLDLKSAELSRCRGDIYLQLGLTDLAAMDYGDALDRDPNDAETMLLAAKALVKAERWSEALIASQQAIRLEANSPKAFQTLAAAHMLSPTPLYHEAIAALQRAHHLAPNEPAITTELTRALSLQAKQYERQGDSENAMASWRLAREVDPEAAAAFRESLAAKDQGKRNHETAKAVEAAAAEEHYLRGRTLLGENRYDEALDELTKAVATNPNVSVYFYERGRAFVGDLSYQTALADFTKAISLNKESANAYAERGRTYCLMNNWWSAAYDLTDAIRLNPRLASAYFNRGVAYYHQKRYDLALNDLANAAQLDPRLADDARRLSAVSKQLQAEVVEW